MLSRLRQEDQEAVKRVSNEVVGLFARSSSCVAGRNGRLSLFHHGQTRLSAGRLKALTVIHNYLSERADGIDHPCVVDPEIHPPEALRH